MANPNPSTVLDSFSGS